MVKKEQIEAFVNYKYIPFSRAQCIKRLVIIWIASIILCFVSRPIVLWLIPILTIDFIFSVFFLVLIFKYSMEKISRYLCDGLFYLYLALILNLTSYRLTVLHSEANIMLAVLLIGLMIVCVLLLLYLAWLNIKSDKYSAEYNDAKSASLPFLAGGIGALLSRFLFQGQSQQTALAVIAGILLFLSLILCISSVSLLKAWLYTKAEK